MEPERVPDISDANLIHDDFARRFRTGQSVEHILTGEYAENPVAVNEPKFKLYAKRANGGLGDPLLLKIECRDEPNVSYWMGLDAFESAVAALTYVGYIVTYADEDYITVDGQSVSVRSDGGEE